MYISPKKMSTNFICKKVS